MRVDPLVGQVTTDALRGLVQHGLMQDRDPVAPVEDSRQVAEQPGPDDHRIRPVDEDVDGDGFSHCATPLDGPVPRGSAAHPWWVLD